MKTGKFGWTGRQLLALPLYGAALISLLLSGCGGPAKKPGEETLLQQNRIQLDADFAVDYKLESKVSQLNGKSCYVFISGTLHNQSGQTLSRRSELDFIVMNRGQMLFRDFTRPVTNIPPGGSAHFDVVTSPLHRDGCPDYEKINVSLRKAWQN